MAFRNLPDMKPSNKPQFAGYGFQFEDGGSSAPVQSVNGKTGAVVLDASDVGAPTAESVTTSFNSVNGKIGDINDNIAPTETTDTASQAYTVGKYFINKDGDLCRVTADIASGSTITLGTNCTYATVGGRIYDIFSAIYKYSSLALSLSGSNSEESIFDKFSFNVTRPMIVSVGRDNTSYSPNVYFMTIYNEAGKKAWCVPLSETSTSIKLVSGTGATDVTLSVEGETSHTYRFIFIYSGLLKINLK